MVQPLFDLEDDSPTSATTLMVGADKTVTNSAAGARVSIQHSQPIDLAPQEPPIYLIPRRLRGTLLDREREWNQALNSLNALQSIVFHGPSGSGKRMLLHHLANSELAANFPDGVIPLTTPYANLTDYQQALFDAFYHTSPGYVPTPDQLADHLQDKASLILIENISLNRADLETLIDLAPQSIFLLTRTEPVEGDDWVSIAVSELPLEAGVELVAQTLEQPLAPTEQAAAETICHLAGQNPLIILQIAALAKTQSIALPTLAKRLEELSLQDDLPAVLRSTLSERQRTIIEVLAAFAGSSLSITHLAALADISDPRPDLKILIDRHLVAAQEQRLQLLGEPLAASASSTERSAWLEHALPYFSQWVAANRHNPSLIQTELGAVMQTLQHAVQTQAWSAVLPLVQQLDQPLFAQRQWGAWERALRWGLQAARELGDQGAAAWALHQLGTRALCFNETDRARNNLQEALNVRLQFEDTLGIEISRHNLDIIGDTDDVVDDELEITRYGGGGSGRSGGGGGGEPPWQEVSIPNNRPTQTPVSNTSRWFTCLVAALLILLLLALGLLIPRLTRPDPGTPAAAPVSSAPLALSAKQINFVMPPPGQASPPRSIMLTNTSTEPYAINVIEVIGKHPEAFQTSSNCFDTPLQPNQTCRIDVQFVPTETGSQEAELVINETDYTISLTGGKVITLNIAPPNVDFQRQQLNIGSIPQVINLTNGGEIDLTINEVWLRGEDNLSFFIPLDECSGFTLKPNDNCQLSIAFFPKTAKLHQAELVITSPNLISPQTAVLRGQGTNPPPTATPIPTQTPTPIATATFTPSPTPTPRLTPMAGVQPDNLNFGSQEVSKDSVAKSVTIRNQSDVSVTVENLTIKGNNANDFLLSSNTCAGITLGRNATCTASLIFRPTAAGSRSASLEIDHSGLNSPQYVTLQGVGQVISGQLCLSDTAAAFNSQDVGVAGVDNQAAANTASITLQNCGTTPLYLYTAIMSGLNRGEFANITDDYRCQGKVLQPGESCVMTFEFQPAAGGYRSAELIINHSGVEQTTTISMAGVGMGIGGASK